MNRKPATKADCERVLTAMHEGKSVRRTLIELGIHPEAFAAAIDSCAILAENYRLAQVWRAEFYVEETIDIADTEFDAVVASNRIKARQWYASKLKPDKFGERIDVNVHATVDIRAAIADGRKRITDAKPLQLEPERDTLEALELLK